MSPYKKLMVAAREYMESNSFLKFLLSAHIYVFALGALIFVLGSFIGAIYDPFTCLGAILVFGGLLVTIISEDVLTLIITSGALSVTCLTAWVVGLVVNPWDGILSEFGIRGYGIGSFRFQPFFYFLIFGAIAIIVLIKSDKLKQMRAEAAARASVPCARCGGAIPRAASFCPVCGAPNPTMQYAPPSGQPYAPPTPPPYAPPAGQPYAPPAPPPYAPPVGQPYTPPAPPPYAPPAPPPYAPPAPPAEPIAEPDAEPVVQEELSAPAEAEGKKCVNCGVDLPAGAVFCGKCGTKQP
jgi:RNA polymerase subunit RPABC4/transcription elongation factor Spt4